MGNVQGGQAANPGGEAGLPPQQGWWTRCFRGAPAPPAPLNVAGGDQPANAQDAQDGDQPVGANPLRATSWAASLQRVPAGWGDPHDQPVYLAPGAVGLILGALLILFFVTVVTVAAATFFVSRAAVANVKDTRSQVRRSLEWEWEWETP